MDCESQSKDLTSDLVVVISFRFLSGGDGNDGIESTVCPDL